MPDNEERKLEKEKKKKKTKEGKHGLEVRVDTNSGSESKRHICPHSSVL